MNKIQYTANPKSRYSNFELLRIIAMFLVLVVHANFFTLSAPTIQEIETTPLPSFIRILLQSISILCVNMFVLISGWFGIKFSTRKVVSFLFQCSFFLVGIYIICIIFNISSLNFKGILECFCLTPWNWFIKAYLLLMIISPILNIYIEKSSEKQIRGFLISFYLFQTFFGWLNGAVLFFVSGCSTISFIGLYILARYIRLYPPQILAKQNLKKKIFIFMIIILLQALICFININTINRVFSYISPLVIISSIYLLSIFESLKFQSNTINYIAESSFAVFLLHTNPNLCNKYFQGYITSIYNHSNGILCIFNILLFLIAIFIMAVIIDKVRIHIWNFISTHFSKNFND